MKDFTEAALALGEREVSDLIETGDVIYLLTPFERVEAHTPPLAEVRDRVLADLRRERGEVAAKERAEKLLARAREADLETAAAEAGLTLEETGPFDRNAATIPPSRPNSSVGTNWQAAVMPTAVALPVIDRTSQSCAIRCTQPPVPVMNRPVRNSRKLGLRSDAKVSRQP